MTPDDAKLLGIVFRSCAAAAGGAHAALQGESWNESTLIDSDERTGSVRDQDGAGCTPGGGEQA